MIRIFFLIIVSFISLKDFANETTPNDLVLLTIKTVTESSIYEGIENDTLFINSNGLPYSATDTMVKNVRFIFKASQEELFFWGAKYWLEILNLKYQDNRIEYSFYTNSWNELENMIYWYGQFEYQKIDKELHLVDSKLKQIPFSKISKLDSPLVKKSPYHPRNYIECYKFDLKNIGNRKMEDIADTLIGNWFSTSDGTYSEYLFINDSIYQYSLSWGKEIPVRYEIEKHNLFVTRYNANTYRLSIDVINFNTIHLYGFDTLEYKNEDPEIYTIDFVIHRIPDSEFTFSDIKCWKEIETKDGKLKVSKDQDKFIMGFMERKKEALK